MASISVLLRQGINPRRPTRHGGERGRRPRARFAFPSLALYSIFVIYPSVATLYYSFTNWNGLGKSWHIVGLANYRSVLSSTLERTALSNTVEATIGIVIGSNLLGLVLALLLFRRSKLNYFLRLVWFLPAALPGIVAGYIWTFLYSPQGPFDSIWHAIDPSAVPPGFLGSPHQALPSIVAIVIWQSSGYSMVILLAGLQAIDHQVQEAARVDGASRFQRFRYITLPLLRPAFTVSVVLTTVTGMLLFDAVVATTDGGPGYSTETLATQLYKQAFLFNNFGFGMAMGVLMSVLILVTTGLLMWVLNRRDLAT